jgi:transcriptional regulator with XRE-family HTH domain
MADQRPGHQRSGRPALRSVPEPDPADQPRVHLGNRLRAARMATGLTMERAAVAAGLTRNTIGSLENARFPDPKLSTLLRLMRVYGLSSLEELLGPVPSARLAAAWEHEGWETSRGESSHGDA